MPDHQPPASNIPPNSAATTTPLAAIEIDCSRGGALVLQQSQAPAFIEASLEDALDLLAMSAGHTPLDEKSPHPRAGVNSVARTRVKEALEAFRRLQK